MYIERPSSTGDIVEVYQPSGKRFQLVDEKVHEQKALAEIYLLSLTDKLVTTAWSTFGYVAQDLGGLKPWILYKPESNKTLDPPCARDFSMEPCFLKPALSGCEAKADINVPFVKHCEDRTWGVKLVDSQ